MRKIIWSTGALRDLAGIDDYWRKRDIWLLLDLLNATDEALDFLKETPGAGPRVDGELRRWRIGRTPYLMLYRYDRRLIRVIRLVHESQNWTRG